MASDPGGTVAKPAKAMFDSKALNGLRGLASLHIVLYHGFWYSEAKIGTYAQVKHIRNVPIIFIFTRLQIFKDSIDLLNDNTKCVLSGAEREACPKR